VVGLRDEIEMIGGVADNHSRMILV
jgi:hypothetical protein